MIAHIAKQEWRQLTRDGRVRLASALVLFLLFVAWFAGAAHRSAWQHEHHHASCSERDLFATQGEKDAHSATHYGLHVFRDVPRIAGFDTGYLPYLGSTLFLESHGRGAMENRAAATGSILQRFQEVTASFALQVVVPLLVVLLAAGSFALERERGRLTLALAQGVSPLRLGVGKLCGLLLALGTILVPFALVTVFSSLDVLGEDPLRLLLLGAGYTFHLLVFLFVALGISALSRSYRTALVFVLAFWFVATIGLPRVGTSWIDHRHPLPTLSEFDTEIEEERRALMAPEGEWTRRREEFERETLGPYREEGSEEPPFDFRGLAMDHGEVLAKELYDRHYGRLYDRMEEADGALTRLGWVTPTLALRTLSMSLSEADLHHHRAFHDAADRYRFDFVRAMNLRMAYSGRKTEGNEFWSSIAPFEYASPSLSTALAGCSSSFWMLGAWLVASALFASFAVARVRAL